MAGKKANMSTVGILGTGDFARALGQRLLTHNYTVVFGSRFPQQRHLASIDPIFTNVQITSIAECIKSADVIFLCIHPEHHDTLKKFAEEMNGRVLIDVSNPTSAPNKDSVSPIAETLSTMFPESFVVKGFNTLSAYALTSGAAGESKIVYICGDDAPAREIGLHIARSVGFVGVDRGMLSGAKELERMSHDLCGKWSAALWITLVVSICWFIYTMLRYYVFRDSPYTWERFPLNLLNKWFGEVGIMLLAFCYLPGNIAAFVQIARGTKYKRFPSWLDTWLKARKYLGLIALLMSTMHTVMSMTLLNAAYFSAFYKSSETLIKVNQTKDIEVDTDSRMSWMGESSVSCGFIGMAFMFILGITSVPAIGNLMNWRQWNFVQTYIGYACLFFCTAHITIKGAYSWVDETFGEFVQSMAFLGSFTPWVVLFLKLILCLPCVKSYLNKIRKGWERNPQELDFESAIVLDHSNQNDNGIVNQKDTETTKESQVNGHDNHSFVSTGL